MVHKSTRMQEAPVARRHLSPVDLLEELRTIPAFSRGIRQHRRRDISESSVDISEDFRTPAHSWGEQLRHEQNAVRTIHQQFAFPWADRFRCQPRATTTR